MKISHYRSSPEAFYVNSYFVELESMVVVVDTQFILPEGAKLVRAVESVGKPLGAIFLTHPHPDHVNGTQLLLDRWPGTPAYATEATRAAIVELAGPKREQWKPVLGDAYPDEVVEPSHIVADEGIVTLDDVEFKFYDLGAIESINETIIEIPTERVAFVGDLFYNKVHPWLVEGRALIWRSALETARERLKDFASLYPGHGDAAGPSALTEQAAYMDRFFDLIRASDHDTPLGSIVESMKREFYEWPLEMLVEMNIAPVRTELESFSKQ